MPEIKQKQKMLSIWPIGKIDNSKPIKKTVPLLSGAVFLIIGACLPVGKT